MIQRYHLDLAAVVLVAGLAVAALDRWLPPSRSRAVALAGAAGALLGSWGSPRGWPWMLLAVALVGLPDDADRSHPLGVWTLPLTVVALAGVWAAVPDTEPPLAAGAVLAPIALARPLRGIAVGPMASAALVVAVSGAVWVGSAGWGAALASVCAAGLLAVAPLLIGMGHRLHGRVLIELVAAQALVSLAVPRVVMSRSVPVAVTIAAVVTAALAALCVWRARQPGEV